MLETAFWIALGLMCHAYVVYPGLLCAVASCWGRKVQSDWTLGGELPSVSLVVPAHNEVMVIAEKLANCLAVDYPADRLEFVVVDDASVDGTREIIESFSSPRFKSLHMSNRSGKAAAMNEAMANISSDIVCFSDANVFLRPDALFELIRPLQDAQVGATTADVRLKSHETGWGNGERLFYQVERLIQSAESALWTSVGVDGGLFAVRKELVRALPGGVILDDFVIAMGVVRQGRRIIYCPNAIAEEDAPPKARHECRRRVRMAMGTAQSLRIGAFPRLATPVALWMYISHKLLRWISPFLALVLFVLSIALIRTSWVYSIPAVLGLASGGLALATYFIRPLRDSRLGGIAVYAWMTSLAFLYGFIRGAVGAQSGVWAPTERSPITDLAPDHATRANLSNGR